MPESNPRNLRTAREIARRDMLFAVARVPSTARLIVGSSSGKVLEIDAAQTAAPAIELADHGRYVTAVGLAGQMVISGGYDGKLIWWDLEKRRVIRTVDDAHARQIRMIAVSPD